MADNDNSESDANDGHSSGSGQTPNVDIEAAVAVDVLIANVRVLDHNLARPFQDDGYIYAPKKRFERQSDRHLLPEEAMTATALAYLGFYNTKKFDDLVISGRMEDKVVGNELFEPLEIPISSGEPSEEEGSEQSFIGDTAGPSGLQQQSVGSRIGDNRMNTNSGAGAQRLTTDIVRSEDVETSEDDCVTLDDSDWINSSDDECEIVAEVQVKKKIKTSIPHYFQKIENKEKETQKRFEWGPVREENGGLSRASASKRSKPPKGKNKKQIKKPTEKVKSNNGQQGDSDNTQNVQQSASADNEGVDDEVQDQESAAAANQLVDTVTAEVFRNIQEQAILSQPPYLDEPTMFRVNDPNIKSARPVPNENWAQELMALKAEMELQNHPFNRRSILFDRFATATPEEQILAYIINQYFYVDVQSELMMFDTQLARIRQECQQLINDRVASGRGVRVDSDNKMRNLFTIRWKTNDGIVYEGQRLVTEFVWPLERYRKAARDELRRIMYERLWPIWVRLHITLKAQGFTAPPKYKYHDYPYRFNGAPISTYPKHQNLMFARRLVQEGRLKCANRAELETKVSEMEKKSKKPWETMASRGKARGIGRTIGWYPSFGRHAEESRRRGANQAINEESSQSQSAEE